MKIEDFVKLRDEALLSLDKEKILNYIKTCNIPPPPKHLFWVSVHKAITGAKTLPKKFRRESKVWLALCNYESLDDGDL